MLSKCHKISFVLSIAFVANKQVRILLRKYTEILGDCQRERHQIALTIAEKCLTTKK